VCLIVREVIVLCEDGGGICVGGREGGGNNVNTREYLFF